MDNSERIKRDAMAIQSIRTTEGLRVILSKMDEFIDDSMRVSETDPLWFQKAMHRDGKICGVSMVRDWILGRLKDFQDNSPPEA